MLGYRSDAFAGRKALVTGGASGIGAAIAGALTEAGGDVTVADSRVFADLPSAIATDVKIELLDVSDTDAVPRFIARRGPFDILVNNAGIDQHAFFTKTTAEEWVRLIDVNLISVLACTHAALPMMQERKFGRIINIASEAARQGSSGGAVYAAAKGGVIAFTKSIARENARYAITANVVCPGPVQTPLLEANRRFGERGEKMIEAMRAGTLLRRHGTPEEVAAAVAFLASPQ